MNTRFHTLLIGLILACGLLSSSENAYAQARERPTATTPNSMAVRLTLELIAAHPKGHPNPELEPVIAQLRSRGLLSAEVLDRSVGVSHVKANAWGRSIHANVEQTHGSRSRVHLRVLQTGHPPREIAVEIPIDRPLLLVVAKEDASLLLAAVQTTPNL